MEVFVPLLVLAVVVVILVYKNNAHAKAIIDAHADTLKSVVSALAPAAHALQVAPGVAQNAAVTQSAIAPAAPTVATAAVLPKAAPDPVADIADKTAQLAAAQANSPQAAGFTVMPCIDPGTAIPGPLTINSLTAASVAQMGPNSPFYIDNTGNVCHFENGAKVMGYATAAAHA
jgi:hypothetical protein